MSIELYTVKLNENKGVEIIQPPGGISVRELGGEIPSGRCRHTLTHYFDSCVILHGGVCFQHRNSCVGSSLLKNLTNEINF